MDVAKAVHSAAIQHEVEARPFPYHCDKCLALSVFFTIDYRVPEAQLLAWSGESGRALSLYDQALAADPDNVAALRGKAEILNWKGRHEEARNLLLRAQKISPQDEATTVELARADFGLHRYREARLEFLQVGTPGPETRDLQTGISQALGTFAEVGYGLRRNRRNFDYDQLGALVSTRVGPSNRLGILYQPTLLRSQQPDFDSNYFGLLLDSQPSERVTTHIEFRRRGLRIEIIVPASNAVVKTENNVTLVRGVLRGAGPGWFAVVDVHTNRWYTQGGKIFPAEPDGAFSVAIYLRGEGRQQCCHVVRARLYDSRGRRQATSVQFGVVRTNADGSPPNCH